MAYKGNLPYDFKLSTMLKQSAYHADDICGSSFHGLATSIELKLKNYDYESAKKQVLRCIEERKSEMQKRNDPDTAHNNAIKVMEDLLKKINNLIFNINSLNIYLPTAIVRYNEEKGYYRIILDKKSKTPQKQEQELEQQNYQRFLNDQEEGEEYDPTHIYIGGKIQRQRQRQRQKKRKRIKTQKDKHKIKHKLTCRNKKNN